MIRGRLSGNVSRTAPRRAVSPGTGGAWATGGSGLPPWLRPASADDPLARRQLDRQTGGRPTGSGVKGCPGNGQGDPRRLTPRTPLACVVIKDAEPGDHQRTPGPGENVLYRPPF